MWLFELTLVELLFLLAVFTVPVLPALAVGWAWRRARRCGGGARVTASALVTVVLGRRVCRERDGTERK